MGAIPWRYLIPRRRYFQTLRIARACPEISGHMDRIALYGAAEILVMLPLFPIILLWLPIEWLLRKITVPRLPDFNQMRCDEVEAAHRIVPLREIRRRMGLPDTTIITRKPESPAHD